MTIEKKFKHAGYKCWVSNFRHRCGYVEVPKKHIATQIGNYDDIPVDVHGGVTYLENTEEGCVVGFDCAHAGDTPEYWTLERVELEVRRLADNLRKLTWDDAVKMKLSCTPAWFRRRVVLRSRKNR